MARMRAPMLSIAWAFACSSCIAAAVPTHPDFQPWLLTGWWYPISVVTDDDKVDLSVVGRMIMPLADGDLDVDFEYAEDGKCFISLNRFWHSTLPGQFISDKGYVVHIVDTDYDEYNIFHMENKGKKILYLDSRESRVSATVKKHFKDLAFALGFPVDRIRYVPPNAKLSFGRRLPGALGGWGWEGGLGALWASPSCLASLAVLQVVLKSHLGKVTNSMDAL
ncbi:lipocalin-like [Anolis sagrei]|uniref:lipocalin-like n=1 Tax=Anolis sagrei TaxID=38937 RepID=UPI00351FB6AD